MSKTDSAPKGPAEKTGAAKAPAAKASAPKAPAEKHAGKGGRVRAVLSLGANLGDRHATLVQAVADLDALRGLAVLEVSPVVETVPVGGPEDQPAYLNAVVIAETKLGAHELLDAIHGIEAAHGRLRIERWGPRTLDIDIVDFGGQLFSDPQLILPHPRASERAFVLEPWRLVDPEAILPGAGPVAELAGEAADLSGLHLRPDLALRDGA